MNLLQIDIICINILEVSFSFKKIHESFESHSKWSSTYRTKFSILQLRDQGPLKMSRPPNGWSGLCYAVQTIMQKIKLQLATLPTFCLGFLLRNLRCNNKLLVVNELLNFLQKRDIHYINWACYCDIRSQMIHMWFEWNQQNQAKHNIRWKGTLPNWRLRCAHHPHTSWIPWFGM
jgi:hypothetical protein